MAEQTEHFEPGERAPDSGIYECECGYHHQWRMDVAGDPLPEFPPGCPSSKWIFIGEQPVG
ncbi:MULTISPECIES: hypothetical protein [Actinomadura]|uniref:Uncharacterized protein n=1 Tax=Actinomadura yumaensis TaxID=111807 RepID=A0ABW2CEJ2_9ACTN|nr:hypothetical protein [Actinomadura sp. J1-007]MWK38424.1 hypothetical protein [Actinomadura sp. J1-007]